MSSSELGPPSGSAHNPYAPPYAPAEHLDGSGRLAGHALSWAYGAGWGLDMTLRLIERLAGRPRVLSIMVGVTDFVCLFIMAGWIHTTWKGIPEGLRGTLSPRRAWLSLFVPLYGFYWAFAVNLTLCDTLNAVLEDARSPQRAPRLLGLFANAFWYLAPLYVVYFPWSLRHGFLRWLPEAFALFDGGLWFAYMLQCDDARLAVARIAARAGGLPAPRLSYLQRSAGP